MRTPLLILGLAAAWLGPLPARAQHPLTLEQALQQAAAGSPALAAAAKELEAVRGAAQQSAARPNPALSATVEDIRPDSRSTTVTLAWPLEPGARRSARHRAAERAVQVATAELQAARGEARARVVAAFFSTLLAQERAQLAQGSVELANRAAQAVGRRVAAGKVSPVDETRARVDLANAQLEAAEAEADLQAARRGLAVQLGRSEADFSVVLGDVATPPARPAMGELAAQLDQAPALAVARLEVQRRQALVEVERSKATPDLSLTMGVKHDAASGRSLAVVGLAMPLPLFDRNDGALLEAARRADKAGDELQALRLKQLAELQDASGRLTLARQALQALTGTVLPAAQQAFDAASLGFDAGKFAFLDVIDAQRALLQARSRYLNTLAAAHLAAAAIDRITGRATEPSP